MLYFYQEGDYNKLRNVKEHITFLKAFIANPSVVGSVIPSSKALSKEMASHVFNIDEDEVVVELGAGTGVITEALLKSGIPHQNLIVIEYSPELVKKLRAHFPKINIIEGNANNLKRLLAQEKRTIKAVISSLPLRSLPRALTGSILEQISHILPKGSKYIQYTYSFTQNRFYLLDHYHLSCTKRVWFNIPPARVDVMTRC